MTLTFAVLTRVNEDTSAASRARAYNRLRTAHCTGIRLGIDWRAIEPTSKGSYDATYLARLDTILGTTAGGGEINSYGLSVCADVFRTPNWASTNTAFESSKPTNNQDYADFAGFIANRYKLSQPTMALGIFDEPNLGDGVVFPAFPAAEYADMVTKATTAIKAVAPNMQVLAGELWPMDASYMTAVYAAWGGTVPAIDGWAIQAYTARGFNRGNPTYRSVFGAIDQKYSPIDGLDACRAVMVANGHTAKNVWVPEWGWQDQLWSENADDPTDAERAQYTRDLVAIFQARSWIVWASPFLLNREGNATTYGMLVDTATPAGIPSQMWRAYQDVILGRTSFVAGRESSLTRTAATTRSTGTGRTAR